MSYVEIRGVSFTYPRTRSPALADVSFSADAGIVGLIGPNGAGKSTLLRLMAALETTDDGEIRIGGQSPFSLASSGSTGLIPEMPLFDEYLTVQEFITGVGVLSGMNPETALSATAALLDRKLGTLSLGQKRRVEIATATMGNPDLLLLDEPTNGLDPIAVSELRNTVIGLRNDARCIVFSSHHLDELQRIADTIVILRAGRCLGCWERGAMIRDHGSVEALFHTTLGNLAAAE